MSDRIHKYLDGEIPLSALTVEERTDVARYEATLAAVHVAHSFDDAPDLTGTVMQRLAQLEPRTRRAARIGNALISLWAPRRVSFQFRPVIALAASVLLAIVGLFALRLSRPVEDPIAQLFVQFRLDAPEAKRVALAGDFTGWKPSLVLQRGSAGVWTIVVPLQPGVHDYAFVIDGDRWTPDPAAPAVDDGFGGRNSRLSLIRPRVVRSL